MYNPTKTMKPSLPKIFINPATWLVLTLIAPTLWGQEPTERSRDQRRNIINVEATLSGFQEVPAILSNGRGEFRAIIRGDSSIIFELSYSGLSSAVLFAHVHFGQPGVNGGILFFLCSGGSQDPCPPSGTIRGKITAADVMAIPEQGVQAGDLAGVIRAIRSGVTYANVHTVNFRAGEIRGQLEED
jgi:CHRD domain